MSLVKSQVLTWIGGAKRPKAQINKGEEWESRKAEISDIIRNRKSWKQATEEVRAIGLKGVT
jgi:hypothetical protein